MLECPIKYTQYDKISDDLYMIGLNTILRFNVALSKKLDDGKRYHFHHEYEYTSDKYIDENKLITIRRQFDYYLSIENIRQNERGIKEYIMIRIQDIMYVQECFNSATRWFRDKKYENLFVSKQGKLIMLGKIEPINIVGLAMGKYLSLEPIVIKYDDNNSTTGVRITLSSPDNYIDISVDRFMGLVYLLNTINMYESAQLLLNYIQRPEYGTNMYAFRHEKDIPADEGGFVESKTTRKIEPKNKQKSFFDKIDEM